KSRSRNTDKSCWKEVNLPMRAEMHYEHLRNTIKELAKHYPDHLVTAISVLGIQREVDESRQSSDAEHPQHDTVEELSRDGGGARVPGIRSGDSGEEQQLSGANLDPNTLWMYEDSNDPATADEKVQRWANTQGAELLSDSSTVDALNTTTPYPSAVTASKHDESSIAPDTKADDTKHFTAHSQVKDASIEFLETLLSKLKDVLDSLSQLRAKTPVGAQNIIAQQGDLFNQMHELDEQFRIERDEQYQTPTESDEFNPNLVQADMKSLQGMREFFEIICSVAKRLFHMALKDHEDWTADACTKKWYGIADRFEWETALPLTVAFTIFLRDKESSQEFKDIRYPVERLFERQNLLRATST
ncbi:MAG: hypothetical protein Q9191_008439, partial [Dirinaria sp. TL-2023a]